MKASHDGHLVHWTGSAVFAGVSTLEAMVLRVESSVFGLGCSQGLVDLGATRCGAIGFSEDLCDDECEQVGRASVPVDACRLDPEIERAAPLLALDLGLDHPVVGIDLVLRLVV